MMPTHPAPAVFAAIVLENMLLVLASQAFNGDKRQLIAAVRGKH